MAESPTTAPSPSASDRPGISSWVTGRPGVRFPGPKRFLRRLQPAERLAQAIGGPNAPDLAIDLGMRPRARSAPPGPAGVRPSGVSASSRLRAILRIGHQPPPGPGVSSGFSAAVSVVRSMPSSAATSPHPRRFGPVERHHQRELPIGQGRAARNASSNRRGVQDRAARWTLQTEAGVPYMEGWSRG